MNQGLYKLVFSKIHRAMVVVAEIVSSRSGEGRRRARMAAGAWLALTMLPGPWMVMSAWADLPAGIQIRDIVNESTRVISSTTNQITFQQLKPQAIVNYDKLNLNAGQQFNVNMQAGWSMLNRVHSVDPSVLNGNVNAAGNLYFVNANGVVIGKDAVFNVGSLFAGTLNITDELFQSGFIDDSGYKSVFELVDTINLTPDQAASVNNAEVRVESGAQINAAKGGKVMLFAPNVKVEKNAVIKTPDGQTILAAGKKIYLKASKDPAGMLVEVAAGGTATNLGKIIAERGNITMMGLAVNQMGTLSATTSVRANGSIKLIAQADTTVVSGVANERRDGIVTLGKGSVTSVSPETNDKEEVLASLAFKTSDINIQGSLVNIDGRVSARGGNVTVSSLVDAASVLNSPVAQRIHLGENATIDVSGVDATASMDRFQLAVQLNSDALKDNPILRGSNLFGKTVYVDARKGTDLFDLQPYIDSTRMATVAEKMTNAGTVTLTNGSEIIAEKGSTINVSGGSTTYTGGSIKESQLVFNGKLVPISQAQPGLAYSGIGDTTSVVDAKWGTTTTYTLGNLSYKVPTFFEGGDAGTLRAVTQSPGNAFVQKLVLDGTLLGNTRVSPQQLLSQNIPSGATLVASAINLDLVKSSQNLPVDFGFGDVLAEGDSFVSRINTSFLKQGFNRIDLQDVRVLNVNTALNVDANGSLTLGRLGSNVNINQNIIARGADIKLDATLTRIADNVKISTAGNFVNNRTGIRGALTQETAENAGSIQAGLVEFGKGVTLDASAGAYIDTAGTVHYGDAGNISFTTGKQLPSNLALSAYGFDKGGELNIQFGQEVQSNLYIGAKDVPPDTLNFSLANSFFNQGGFSKYHLGAFNIHVGTDNVGTNSTVAGAAKNLQMKSGFTAASSADDILSVSRLTTLPDYLRQAVSFDFATFREGANLGVLTVHENAHIKTDMGGSIQLSAGKQVNVLGDITARGGDITLKINDNSIDLPEDPSQMVFVGSKAVLNASGTSYSLPDSRSGLERNQVVNAGTITINSDDAQQKGAVVIRQGALLNVSGANVGTKTLTNRGYISETLYGDAGDINLYGYGSLLVDGKLSGRAQGTGRGGNLAMVFESVPYDTNTPYVNDSGRFYVTNTQQLLTTDIQAGDTLKNPGEPITAATGRLQRAQISAAQIESGGFDNVHLGSFINDASNPNSRLVFSPNLDLAIAGNLRLDSSVLQVLDDGHAKLSAGHMQLYSRKADVDPSVLNGNGQLTLKANQIYIDGLMATSGVNRTNLNALRDIHGQGETAFVQIGQVASQSGLTTQGELNLTARQIYPDSGARLTFAAEGAGSRINVRSSGLAPSNVLSGGGILTLQANKIQQDGVLKAPFGQIHLNAAESVTLGDGSLTTVSGSGQNIPFGMTISAGEVFNPGDGKTRQLVEKEISINAPDTKLSKGANVDLSGGGELFAYEWVSGGVGGTQDILAQPDTYALIPAMKSEYAAADRIYNNGSAGIGQTIYITGVAGVPSGTYTLLPARYALVPGAFIVQRSDASLVRGQTSALQDGSMLTTGYMADLNTGAKDANWSTFRVIDGSVLRPAEGAVSKAPSQYIITNASSYFNDPLNTGGVDVKNTQDAGKLTLQAQQLALEASVVGRKITGADGLMVDISSNSIRVVNQKDSADNTSLQLQASQLNALNADSILLGGTRSQSNNTTNINTVANSVSIENDASQVLQTGELMATATNSVNVASGAVIDTGTRNANAKTVNVNTSGDGAFLGLSSNHQLQYTRTGSSINAQSGNLNIADNAQISAGNALVIDGSQNVTFEGNIALADGANATLGSKRILIGDVPTGVSGLHVSDQTLAQLDNVASLTLNSYSTVDTYGEVSFGHEKLNLTVNAAGIAGHLANGEVAAPANQTVTFNTKTFTLKNTSDAIYAGGADTSGRTLQINAESVHLIGDPSGVLENNAVAVVDKNTIGGFDGVQVNAKSLTVAERGALDLQVNQTRLNVGKITASSTADYTIGTAGNLTTTQGDTTGLAANTNIGGKLTLQADQLSVNSRIETLAGQVNLQGNTQLHLGSQAVVTAASATKAFADKTTHIDAGKVQLSSGGDVVVDAGAVVNVSAQGDADAGKVSVSATSGNLQLQGQLDGRASGTGKGGSLDVDVSAMPSVVAIDQQAQGFSQSRSYRVRTGDVAVDGSGVQALAAKNISVTADQGAINVSGTINANSDKQGSISLNANGDVTLQSTAQLTANSSKAGAEGGKVMLATQNGALNLNQGASISVAGGANGTGGSVNLRAPRTGAGSGNGVAVNALETTIAGARSVVLEAVKVFDNVNTLTSSGDGSGGILGYDTLDSDAGDFMVNQASILTALGKSGDSSFHLRAGQEIRSDADADINVDADWDLSAIRGGNEPGILTLRAASNLNVNGSISDGFNGTGNSATISTGDSWSYRFVSGADMHSANVMSTVPSTLDSNGNSQSGNFNLAGGVLVRTGTGDIEIATGGDLVMGNENSVIYTAGTEASELAGFTLPVSTQRPLYLDNGGDITLNVRGNINGSENDNRQVINQWLFRQAGGNQLKDASWWIRNDQFRQSLGALGGGDVTINAGGNIANFSASVPTSARFDNFGDAATGVSVVNGGGDLSISAGGDLYSGVYFVGKGEGTIKVGGSIGVQPDKLYGTILAMMDGQFDVSAGKDVTIEGTVNPTLLPQSTTNAASSGLTRVHNSYFNTYSETAAVTLNALTGNIRYSTQLQSLLTGSTGLRAGADGGIGLNPGTVNMAAHNGSITMGQAYLVPASKGNLSLLAEQTISIDRLLMSDANISDLPNINRPEESSFIGSYGFDNNLLSNNLPYFNTHASSLLHANDFQSSLIVSKTGDINSYEASVTGVIYLPKASQIVAGQDVTNLNIALQNNRSSDISVITAGRDVNTKHVVIAGPGNLLVQAGRNVDLIYPEVSSIQAVGSTGSQNAAFDYTPALRANSLLPATGASISMLAGVGTGGKVQSYIDRYIAPTGAGPETLEGNAGALAGYREKTAAYLLAFMKKLTGDNSLTQQQAFDRFNNQAEAIKTVFVNRHLTTELINSAEGFAKAGNHERGYDALATLYPVKTSGDILLFNSKISTNSGGSIDMVAPNGLINVGVPGQGGDDIGIITEKGGEIRAIADGDFSVNQSKVITQFGSDIAIWSTNGTIDAGRGSKAATSIPERIVQTDVYGNTRVEVRGVASGSGIRAQTYDPDGPNGNQKAPTQGNVYLTAPIVDAGEAGIEGIVRIVAPVILNAVNIQAGAGSTGVPASTTTPVAGLNTTTNPDSVNAAAQAVAQNVANSAANNAFTKPVLPSIISVDVIGIGR